MSLKKSLITAQFTINLCVCARVNIFRWEMLQTHLLCLPPPSPRSTTSSWVPCTARFVSPYNKRIAAVLIHAWMMSPNRCTISSSAQSVFILFPYRYTVPHGQLHPATCCISQAVNLEASRVLHNQSRHQ